MTFWAAFKESVLEFLFGQQQLQAWRDEKAKQEECERTVRRFAEESRAVQ